MYRDRRSAAAAVLWGVALFALAAAPLHAGSVSGRLIDSEGRPVAGARVVWTRYVEDDEALVLETEGRDQETLGETRSDANGAFRVPLEKPGLEVALRIEPAGVAPAELPGPYSSEENAVVDELRFPAAAKQRGRVVDEKGAGVSGARVSLRLDLRRADGAVFVAKTRAHADGSWEIAAAPDGARAELVRAAGFVPSARVLFRRETVEATPLARGAAVRGTVLDASGKPASGAIVLAGEVAARTDGGGVFQLDGLAPGTVTLEGRRGDLVARASASVRPGTAASASLRLARAATIAGSVVDETTRRPVAGARIALRSGSAFGPGPPARRARADPQGRFRAAGVFPGRYTVDAAAEGYLPSDLPGIVAAGNEGKPLAIALRREASVSGIVLDEQGKPVAGARVGIPREPNFRRGMRAFVRAAFAARDTGTGADGRFALRGLSAETGVTVEATKAGFAPARRTGLRVKTGESIAGIALVLRRGLAASGRVVDGEGRGIPGVEIRANHIERGARRGGFRVPNERSAPDATSGSGGAFALAGLEEGRYLVAASRDGFAPKPPVTAEIVKGKENRIAPIVLETGAAVAGFVRDKSGVPIPGAEILVPRGQGTPSQVLADGEGAFRLAGLAPGRSVFLFVSAAGYASRQSSATPPATGLAIMLDTTGSVSGRVQDADTKAPLVDFTITRAQARGGGFGGARFLAGADAHSFHAADGAFRLEGVPPGRWTVRAEAPGYRTAEAGSLDVAAGGVAEDVVLSLKRGGNLTGRVTDAARGTGVANASVSWAPAGSGDGGGPFGPASSRDTTTDADGRYAFDALPDGKIVVSVSHPDYMEASVDVDTAKQATADIALTAGGAISGVVMASDGRTPAAGARVTLDAQGESGRLGMETAAADGAGAFLFDHLRAGRYELGAQTNAGASPAQDLILADGQRADGIVLLTSGGTLLQGTVSGLAAAQLAGLRVVASSPSGYADATTTDDSGHFSLPDVPSGVVRLSASTAFPRTRSAQSTVEVPDGIPEMPVEIVFDGTSTLSGRVTRGGSSLAGVFVASIPVTAAGGGRATTQTDGDGRYSIEGLYDGTYRVTLSGQSVTYSKSIDVSGDTNGDIEVPGATISGMVTDAGAGTPLEGASVSAETGQETQSAAVKRAVTDSNGAYTIPDVDPGAYQITARLAGYRLKTQPATVSDEGASLDFALTKGSGLSIRVSDGTTGIPLAGVQALAFAADGTVAFQGRVPLDSGGEGEIPSLADGRYAIALFSDGYAARNLPAVDVPSPEVPVAMTPGGRVEVRPSAAVAGRLTNAAGGVVLLSPFRLDGSVTAAPPVTVWEHLAPGAYRFVAAFPDGEKAFAFQVAEGQTTSLAVK